MSELLHKLDIQFFAKDGDEGADAPILTFDELMTDKYYQSEFDRRMQSAQEKATAKYKEQVDELKDFKTKYETINAEYEGFKATADKTKAELKAESEIELEMVRLGARDTVAVKAHLRDITDNKELDAQERVRLAKEKLAGMTKEQDYLFGGKNASGFELGKGDNEANTLKNQVEKSMGVK